MCGAVDLNSIFVSIMLCTSTGFCWSIERVRENKEADHEELLRIVSTYLNIISQKSPLHSLYFQHLYSTDWGCKPWNKRNQWSHPEKVYWHKSLKYSLTIFIGFTSDLFTTIQVVLPLWKSSFFAEGKVIWILRPTSSRSIALSSGAAEVTRHRTLTLT